MNKEIVYVGSRTQNPAAWDVSLALMGAGKVDVEKLVTSIRPLDGCVKLADELAHGERAEVGSCMQRSGNRTLAGRIS